MKLTFRPKWEEPKKKKKAKGVPLHFCNNDQEMKQITTHNNQAP